MHMLYNSDSFTVVLFEIPLSPAAAEALPAVEGPVEPAPAATRGGFEIVDKLARTDIFIEGAIAESFKAGVEALMAGTPSEEDLDAYIGRYASLMPQPLVLH